MTDLLDATSHLPWGLHDATLVGMEVDFEKAMCRLRVVVMLDERQTTGRLGEVVVSGLSHFACEPIDDIRVDAGLMGLPTIDVGRFGDKFREPEFVASADASSWSNWIFLSASNSFIYMVAKSAAYRDVSSELLELKPGVIFPGESI